MEKLSGSSGEPSHRVLSLEQEQRGGHFPLGGLQDTPAPVQANRNNRMPAPPMPPAPAQAPPGSTLPDLNHYISVGCPSILRLTTLSCGWLALFPPPACASLPVSGVWIFYQYLSLPIFLLFSFPHSAISVFLSLSLWFGL